jgi:uncharacterized alkaline shock family protein YloU
MPERSMVGRSIVTRRAIVDIVRAAVQGSYGVTGFTDPSLGRRIAHLLGVKRQGIRLTTDGGIRVELYITVAFGVPVAEVARQIDSAVRYSLRHYISASVQSLIIHVDGLRYQPTAVERAQAIEDSEGVENSVPEAGHQRAENEAAGAPASRKRKPR